MTTLRCPYCGWTTEDPSAICSCQRPRLDDSEPLAGSIDIPSTETQTLEISPVDELHWPAWVKRRARHRIPADKGVGDTLQRHYARFGGEIFKMAAKAIGWDCGCSDKQAHYNRLYPYR